MLERYRVERADGEGLGAPVDKRRALEQADRALRRADSGDVVRIRKVFFELPPEAPPGGAAYTPAALRLYRLSVRRFPLVGYAGGFVCKWAGGVPGSVSQHAIRTPKLPSAGNAHDFTAPDEVERQGSEAIIEWLWAFVRWQVRAARAGELPLSEGIFRDRKWRLSSNRWAPYTGAFHASHVHDSAAPYIDRAAACLNG